MAIAAGMGISLHEMKKFQLLLLVLGIALLVYVLLKLGIEELGRELGLLGWGLVPLVAGEGLAEMIHTFGWRHCLNGSLRSMPWVALYQIRMAGYAINYLTPTAALGGEVTKGVLLASHQSGPDAASGVLIGKLCFALAHLVFVMLGALLVLWRLHLPGALWLALLAYSSLIATGLIVFFLLLRYGMLGAVLRGLAKRKHSDHLTQRAMRKLTLVDEATMRFCRERPGDFVLAIAWHLAGYCVGIAQTWLFLRLLHHHPTWTMAAAIWFIGMWFDLLTFAVPLNLGTLEGTRVLIFQITGYPAVMGLTYGLALRLAQIFWSGFGLISHAILTRSLPASQRASAPRPLHSLTVSREPCSAEGRAPDA